MTQKYLAGVVVPILLIGSSIARVDAQPYIPAPNYAVPTPGYAYPMAPNYASPAAPTGYDWRDTRGAGDWRNNTWREDNFDENWRNRNWQTRRELQDWRQREDVARQRTPDNPFEQGYVECGRGAAGVSFPCSGGANYGSTRKQESTNGYQKTGDGYDNEPGDNRQKAAARGIENCGHLSVWRRC